MTDPGPTARDQPHEGKNGYAQRPTRDHQYPPGRSCSPEPDVDTERRSPDRNRAWMPTASSQLVAAHQPPAEKGYEVLRIGLNPTQSASPTRSR